MNIPTKKVRLLQMPHLPFVGYLRLTFVISKTESLCYYHSSLCFICFLGNFFKFSKPQYFLLEVIKSTVPTSKQPIKIKFVKKGTRVKNKNSSPSGILHQASDWVLLGDLDGSFSFPPHIAFTELRPDITICSNKLKRVILIELTCPCEENMEAWHNVKVNKYMPLKSVIENNGWNVDLLAVEVGARVYCSRSVLCCFKSLGLRNRTINTTIKQLSKCSMECCFCI